MVCSADFLAFGKLVLIGADISFVSNSKFVGGKSGGICSIRKVATLLIARTALDCAAVDYVDSPGDKMKEWAEELV
jgi:hypothetical protein